MDLQKINLKFYLADGHGIPAETWFKVFNEWVPTVTEEVLIDVADYSHVSEGPVTLLVGHDANYSIDNHHNRLGLLYQRKQPLDGNLFDRIRGVFLRTIEACSRLEAEPELEGRVKFSGDEVQFALNDRLLAPNSEETLSSVQPELEGVLNLIYAGAAFTLVRNPDPYQQLTLDIKTEGTWDIGTLLKNIQSVP